MPLQSSSKFSKQVGESFIFLQQLMTSAIYKRLVPSVNLANIVKNFILAFFKLD
jgi:hypothetical protein